MGRYVTRARRSFLQAEAFGNKYKMPYIKNFSRMARTVISPRSKTSIAMIDRSPSYLKKRKSKEVIYLSP